MLNEHGLKTKVIIITSFIFFVLIVIGCSKNKDVQELTVYPVFNNHAANSYIAAGNGEAVVIDPSDQEQIISILTQKGLKLRYIILTHGHFDHIVGLDSLVGRFPETKVLIHPSDSDKPADPVKNLSSRFSIPVKSLAKTSPVTQKDIIKIGDTEIKVIETPGHTPGSIVLLTGKRLFTGDTLFKGAIGRTDFPGGSSIDLTGSLKKIVSLNYDLTIYPGHGDISTLNDEKASNPYLIEIE